MTVVAGSFAPDPFGLHEVHGNVAEWIEDCRYIDHQDAPIDGTAWLSSDCDFRGLHGGYWRSRPSFLRPDARKTLWADYARDSNGLRVARDLSP